MAKPLYQFKEQIGIFIATTSQESKRAPLVIAQTAASLGCIAGQVYAVFVALKIDNVVWLLLESQVPNTPEWVREVTETGGSTKSSGKYRGPEPMVIL